MDNINIFPSTPSGIELSFTWSPATTYTIGVTAYPAAAANTLLTFVAHLRFYNDGDDLQGPLSLAEYRWDFGDGVIDFGASPTHTYNQAYFNAQTVLRVTDSMGRFWYTRAQMYLS